jgi:hypothetical protein
VLNGIALFNILHPCTPSKKSIIPPTQSSENPNRLKTSL